MRPQSSQSKLGVFVLGSSMLLLLAGVALLIGTATGDWLAALVSAAIVGMFVPLIMYGRYLAGRDTSRAEEIKTFIFRLLKWMVIAVAFFAVLFEFYLMGQNN